MFRRMRDLLFVAVAVSFAILACGPGGGGESTGSSGTSSGSSGDAITSLDGVKDATIYILAEGSLIEPGGAAPNAQWTGSGFIIDPSGIAVTNNHVVTGNASLKVYVEGKEDPVSAKVLGVSECSDLAVIDLEGDGYPFLSWSSDPPAVGRDVRAAGFPLGDPEFTLTSGIISA